LVPGYERYVGFFSLFNLFALFACKRAGVPARQRQTALTETPNFRGYVPRRYVDPTNKVAAMSVSHT
jgi:hypothetical protein